MGMSVRVRFAPSPTGPLHLGGVRTALYNYLFAKKHNGTFILRIEDTDQNRFVAGAEEYIMNSLAWCGISINEGIKEGGNFGPYKQSERKHIYKQYAQQLIDSGNAYYAFDTAEELEALRKENPNFAYNASNRMLLNNSLSLSNNDVQRLLDSNTPYVIRIKVPQEEEVSFKDIVRGFVSFNTSQIDDKVMFKSDGMPTYHLANVVDDHLMEITHVIRGEEWLPSTPIHVLLYQFFDWQDTMPQFAHLPLILKPDGNGKLSKRDGDRLGFPVFPLNWTNPETNEKSEGFKERGFLPEAFANFLAMLGWNPGTEQEIFNIDELIELFNIEKLHKAGAKFDYEKAKWFNSEHIKQKSNEAIAALYLQENNLDIDKDYLIKVVALIKDRLVFIQDIDQFNYFFQQPQEYNNEQLSKIKGIKDTLNITDLVNYFDTIDYNNIEIIELSLRQFVTEHQLKMGDFMKFLRISIVGELSGPAIPNLIQLLGKTESLNRIKICYYQL
ncbi:MAG: glutamate--tRNA ligase [Sphingobacteriales bacterium]|nr:MAG: glutamate--tRNA ligase [Sphingobacteriales bacterium]